MTDTPPERAAGSTWTRLRRRKVVQWGVVYVAAAWGFLQGLEYVSESFNWPQEVRHIALLALARTDGRRQTGKQDQRQSDCESKCTDSPKLLLAVRPYVSVS